MTRWFKRGVALAAVIGASVVSAPTPAGAHNVGHVILPDGTCRQVGSDRHAPLVGPDKVRLDLDPSTPADEYGALFASFQGRTPILPGRCP